jgi:hypothetical protein
MAPAIDPKLVYQPHRAGVALLGVLQERIYRSTSTAALLPEVATGEDVTLLHACGDESTEVQLSITSRIACRRITGPSVNETPL